MKRLLEHHWFGFLPLPLFWNHLSTVEQMYRAQGYNGITHRFESARVERSVLQMMEIMPWLLGVTIGIYLLHAAYLKRRGWPPLILKLLALPFYLLFCAATVFHAD